MNKKLPNEKSKSMSWITKTGIAACFGLVGFAPLAHADVAANATIRNSASLSYNDGTGTKTVSSTVDVLTETVLCAPSISSTPAAFIDKAYQNTDTSAIYSYQAQGCGNGPASYNLVTTISAQTNTQGGVNPAAIETDGAGVNDTASTATVTLGATVAISGSTGGASTVITVPDDQDDSDGIVNGLAVNDIVFIDDGAGATVQAVITAIEEDNSNLTSTITIDAAYTPASFAGLIIVERYNYDIEILSGLIATSGINITVDVDVDVSSSFGSATTFSDTQVYTSGAASLVKYVRNLTDTNANAGGTGALTMTVFGSTREYYTDGVTAEPDDVLEYVLRVNNPPGGSTVTEALVQDTFPTDFVVFQTDTYGANNDIQVDSNGVTADGDTDSACVSGANLVVHIGTSAAQSDAACAVVPSNGGSIAADTTVLVAYQVKVIN